MGERLLPVPFRGSPVCREAFSSFLFLFNDRGAGIISGRRESRLCASQPLVAPLAMQGWGGCRHHQKGRFTSWDAAGGSPALPGCARVVPPWPGVGQVGNRQAVLCAGTTVAMMVMVMMMVVLVAVTLWGGVLQPLR